MRTIAVLNQKGGVGKTTTAVNTAAALAAAGRRVIVIDLDPQAHLTIHLGVEPQAVQTGAYEVMTQSADFLQSLMLVRPNLWLLAANINLVGAETELVSVVGREIVLREAMQACEEEFDFCLIDCAPSLGLLSLNALAAAQEVLIPLQPHFLALQGFGKLLQTIDLVNKRINPHLRVTGVLLCMYDTRASLPNEVRADIARFLTSARGSNNAWSQAEILPTFIRRNIKLAEAPSYGQTIFEYDPTCNGAEDYGKVAKFLLGIQETPEPAPAVAPEPPPKLQSDSPAEAPPAAPPIPIASVNLPAPRCYSPMPIWTELAASAPPLAPREPHHDESPADSSDPVPRNEAALEVRTPELLPESEPANEHASAVQQEAPEPPPIQIREFQLPAPQTYSPRPFQNGPSSPISQPKPSAAHNEVPDEPQESHDEPEQVGF